MFSHAHMFSKVVVDLGLCFCTLPNCDNQGFAVKAVEQHFVLFQLYHIFCVILGKSLSLFLSCLSVKG